MFPDLPNRDIVTGKNVDRQRYFEKRERMHEYQVDERKGQSMETTMVL